FRRRAGCEGQELAALLGDEDHALADRRRRERIVDRPARPAPRRLTRQGACCRVREDVSTLRPDVQDTVSDHWGVRGEPTGRTRLPPPDRVARRPAGASGGEPTEGTLHAGGDEDRAVTEDRMVQREFARKFPGPRWVTRHRGTLLPEADVLGVCRTACLEGEDPALLPSLPRGRALA